MIADAQSGRILASRRDGAIFALDSWGQEIWRRRFAGLDPQGLVERDDVEVLAVLRGAKSSALAIDRRTGRVSWSARLGPGAPGRLQVVGDRWLMQLRPQGQLAGFWMPPSQGALGKPSADPGGSRARLVAR